MLNNYGPAFKIHLTIIKNRMQKNGNLEKVEVLYKAIEKKELWIKADHKALANFAVTKSNAKTNRTSAKKEKEFVE